MASHNLVVGKARIELVWFSAFSNPGKSLFTTNVLDTVKTILL